MEHIKYDLYSLGQQISSQVELLSTNICAVSMVFLVTFKTLYKDELKSNHNGFSNTKS